MVRTRTRPFRRAITVAVIPALLLLGSCSKSVSPVCSDAQNLKDAVQGLTQVDVKTGGVAALQTAVDNVKSAAAALGTEAKSTFGTQVSAIQAQVTALGGRDRSGDCRRVGGLRRAGRGLVALPAEDRVVRSRVDGSVAGLQPEVATATSRVETTSIGAARSRAAGTSDQTALADPGWRRPTPSSGVSAGDLGRRPQSAASGPGAEAVRAMTDSKTVQAATPVSPRPRSPPPRASKPSG